MKNTLQAGLWMGLAVLMFVGQPEVRAAAPKGKRAKTPAASAKTPRRVGIARDPYLGAIVVDAATGKVLVEDKPDAKGYPASVLKLMDLLIILEKVDQHQLTFQDQVVVSSKAANTGGSQVWLADRETFTIDELLYSLMIQSANDSAVALAEKVAGSTEAFVGLMNKRAQELGMTSTVFNSVHGLPPGAGQQPDVTTPRDFSVLCRELLKHQDTLRYTSTRERPFRPNGGAKMVLMRTHNHLLGQVEGCDGLKTGFYTVAGYSIAVTASRQGQRVIAVVLGSVDRKLRDAKAAELIGKGFLALRNATPPAPQTSKVAPPAPAAPKR